MAVEQLNASLGTTSPYDNISAVIRGKIVPVEGQSFSVDLDGIGANFEIETVNEKVRGVGESCYAIAGRELRSEFIYRAVDFDMNMRYDTGKSAFSMPTACEIIGSLGISYDYDAPDFRPTQSGMGWKTTATKSGNSYSCKVRIREKNIQALMDKLFGWSGEFGKKKICWHVRCGVLHIWELQRASSQPFTITEAMCPGTLNIDRQRVRKFSEATDISGTTVSTPTGTWQFDWLYADVPFSGGFSWDAASMTYSDGLLVEVVADEADGTARTETYGYQYWYGGYCMTSKTTTSSKKKTQSTYTYGRTHEGSTSGSGRDVPCLAREETISWTRKVEGFELDSEKTVIEYHPLGNGFYGITAIRYVDGEAGQVQHSVSRGSPGGAASQYTERQVSGWKETYTEESVTFPGYVLASTRLPLESGDLANEYLEEYKNLHGSIESKITAEIIGQAAIDPIKGKIIFRGVEYYATDVTVIWKKDGKRMNVTGVRWDYDVDYRINTLGFDS